MLIDKFGRKIDYLRISVTQRCNFRCRYCMPHTPFNWTPKENLLSFEELFSFVKIAIDEGIEKIRITGGEPLIRKDLPEFIKMISEYAPNVDLALTTNGYFLSNYAKILKQNGLKRINMSLDSLRPEMARFIAQKGVLHSVLAGLDSALEAGLKVKINTVALKGINDDELPYLLEFAKSKNCMIRFIEFMENTHANANLKGLNRDEILEILSTKFNFKFLKKFENSPASIYQIDDGYSFGIIDPHKHDFCESCNRIRLSAEGHLIPCLYFEDALSIKDAVRSGNLDLAREILKEVLANKPEKNRWELENKTEISNRAFYETGG